jgi:hypothetical protein
MNAHLSPEEISNWFLGNRDSERARHVRECAACGREVAALEAALGEFRSAVENWDAPPPVLKVADWRVPRVARWALAAAAAALLAAAPLYLHHRQVAADSARADALLLEQVDAEVSRAVPRPMAPLVQMVAWSSSTGETQ